jgi:hypothetical protein
VVDFAKLLRRGRMFSDKEKDSMMWLYNKGVDAHFIADSLNKGRSPKIEGADVANCIWDILRGVESCPPIATQAAFDKTDWSLREEYILRTMRGFNQLPSRVADLLGRGHDQIKRKWKEMRERDTWLHDYAIKRSIQSRKPDVGGVPPKKEQGALDLGIE